MSGKKKMFRKTTVLVNSRRGGGRRTVRPSIVHRASRQVVLSAIILAAFWIALEALFEVKPLHGAEAGQGGATGVERASLAEGNWELSPGGRQLVVNQPAY